VLRRATACCGTTKYITGTLQRPGARPFTDPDEAVDKSAFGPGAAATIGTPDDLVARIKEVLAISDRGQTRPFLSSSALLRAE
jgi:hypothetical protein